jgi:hypothetical protein
LREILIFAKDALNLQFKLQNNPLIIVLLLIKFGMLQLLSEKVEVMMVVGSEVTVK